MGREQVRLREERADTRAAHFYAIEELRRAVLPRLSSAQRSKVTGFGEVGRTQLEQELGQLELRARLYLRTGFPEIPARVGSWLVSEAWTVLWLAALFVLAMVPLMRAVRATALDYIPSGGEGE